MKKVLFVLPEFPPDHGGGIVTFYRDLIVAMNKFVECSVLVGSAFTNGRLPYEYRGITVDVLQRNLFEKWLNCFDNFQIFPQLQRHLAAAYAMHQQAKGGDGYDAVEVVDWGLLFAPWILEPSAPTTVQLHGSSGQIAIHDPCSGSELEELLICLLESNILQCANLQTHSKGNRDWWEKSLGRHVEYCPPAFDSSHDISSMAIRSNRFLSVARIQKWKGPQVLCEALKTLGNSAPDVDWIGRDTVFGDSSQSMDQYLRNKYHSIWNSKIIPIGARPPAQVISSMRSATAMVIPSTWDVFNLASVEAMSCATPVIVSSGAGVVDLIVDGENGFVFMNEDSTQLASVINTVQHLPIDQLSLLGDAGRQTVKDILSPEKIAQANLHYYRTLAEWKRPRVSGISTLLKRKSDLRTVLDNLPMTMLGANLFERIAGKILRK